MIPHWGMERARIMKVIFDNNSFVGISIETYNRREYVIKSENGVETYCVDGFFRITLILPIKFLLLIFLKPKST